MRTIFSAPGLLTIEHDPVHKRYVSTWQKYHGPHFREGIEAMLTDMRKHGVQAYIANASAAKDVPAQPDFQWVESYVKAELLKCGLKKFITVVPQSSIAKMTTSRFSKAALAAGVDAFQVTSLEDAIAAAEGKLQAA